MTGSDASYDRFTTVKIEFEDGIAWVILNRPEKRNAMNPTLNREMMDVLDQLEVDDRCKILMMDCAPFKDGPGCPHTSVDGPARADRCDGARST